MQELDCPEKRIAGVTAKRDKFAIGGGAVLAIRRQLKGQPGPVTRIRTQVPPRLGAKKAIAYVPASKERLTGADRTNDDIVEDQTCWLISVGDTSCVKIGGMSRSQAKFQLIRFDLDLKKPVWIQ